MYVRLQHSFNSAMAPRSLGCPVENSLRTSLRPESRESIALRLAVAILRGGKTSDKSWAGQSQRAGSLSVTHTADTAKQDEKHRFMWVLLRALSQPFLHGQCSGPQTNITPKAILEFAAHRTSPAKQQPMEAYFLVVYSVLIPQAINGHRFSTYCRTDIFLRQDSPPCICTLDSR